MKDADKVAALIIAKVKKAKGEAASSPKADPLASVAKDLIAAVHGKDEAAVAKALRAAVGACGSEE